MAIKTFTTGEVLTASDTNTYLANSGLVYVTSATVGSGVSSVTVSNCFSSTYDNYRIVFAGINCSNVDWYLLKINGSSGATYSFGGTYGTYSSSAVNGKNGVNFSAWQPAVTATTTADFVIDINRPFLTTVTTFNSQGANSGYWSLVTGYDSNAASSTGLIVSPNVGTITGGTITIYGYRKGS